MSSQPTASAADPWRLAFRIEQGAEGERLARAMRDHALATVGAAPGCLASISGPVGAMAAGNVARWLWSLTAAAGLERPARALWGRQAGHPPADGAPIVAPELAARELARQVLDFASERSATSSAPSVAAPHVFPPDAEALGRWLASAIEGAGLAEAARALWEQEPTEAMRPSTMSGGRLLADLAREVSASPFVSAPPPPPYV